MFTVGSNAFKSFLEYYEFVMDRYFRRTPPVPSNLYLSTDVAADPEIRIKVAGHCNFPTIINTLANDEDERVREAARKNPYWQLIGRFHDILGFAKRERKEFARIEGQHNLIVLLMLEVDADVISEALKNPAMSINMLALFLRFLKKRGKGRKDEQIYEIGLNILKEKREQIIKISEIRRASREKESAKQHTVILQYLSDQDRTVRQAIAILLSRLDANTIRDIIHKSLDGNNFEARLDHFLALSELNRFCKKREELNHMSVNYLDLPAKTIKEGHYRSIADYFNQLLNQKRIKIIETCAEDVTDFDNIIILTYCHVDSEKHLQHLAATIMTINELINLVKDSSTPRKVFNKVLQILSGHFDESIVQEVHQVYHRESSRLKESLKEMEISVQAYFDIIFQSLGYDQINEYKNVIRSIETAEKQIGKFDKLIESYVGRKYRDLDTVLNDVKYVLKEKANGIYFDTSPQMVKELEYIESLLAEIFELKEMGLSSLRPGTPEDIESEMRARARTIWQSAISTYLGRIKDLSEMIRKKLSKIGIEENISERFDQEIQAAVDDMEREHKNRVQCHLEIPCRTCTKRGCAAERFLIETQFFLQEYIDNFTGQEKAAKSA